AVGSTVATGGTAGAVGGTVVFGAVFKAASNMAHMGSDYEGTFKQVLSDVARGSLSALLNFLRPQHLMASLGAQPARPAAKAGAVDAGKEFGQGALRISYEQLEKETARIVSQTLASGAKTVDQAAVKLLAENAVGPSQAGRMAELLNKGIIDALKLEG